MHCHVQLHKQNDGLHGPTARQPRAAGVVGGMPHPGAPLTPGPEGCLIALPAWPPPGSEQAAMLTTTEMPRNVARGRHGVGSLPGLVWGGVVHLSQAASSC